VVSTQWAGAVSPGPRSTGMEKSDPIKWLAPTGVKPKGHDDGDDDSFTLNTICFSIKTLTRLSINKNEIRNEGARYLAAALRVNTTLQKLNLSDNPINFLADEDLLKNRITR
ncbi:unnamed protein product, partial [Adineta ricciae]